MGSTEKRDFYIAKIENRIPRLKNAIEEKNVNFNIAQFREEVTQDLKVVEEITEQLIENINKDASNDVTKKFLEIQRELETSFDAFDKLLEQKAAIERSNYVQWLSGRVSLAIKYNKWQLLCQIITITVAIFCLIIGINLYQQYYCNDFYLYDDGTKYWIHTLCSPERALKRGSTAILFISTIGGIVCFACSFQSIRKRLKDFILWAELIMATIQCGIWLFVLIVCAAFVYKYNVYKAYNPDCSELNTVLSMTIVLASIPFGAQVAIGILKAVRIVRRKLRNRMLLEKVRNETESWRYAEMRDTDATSSRIELSNDNNDGDGELK